eukprot:Filipodium_phascolosomae@DN513_c0_g1_i1.p1
MDIELAEYEKTKMMMQAEYSRMALVGEQLDEDSQKISEVQSKSHEIASGLKIAGKSLSHLKRKTDANWSYVFGAFIIFTLVCSYIISKRLGVLWLVGSITQKTFRLLQHIKAAVFNIVSKESHEL